MTPYGSDRARVDGERIVLSSRLPKGWTARVARTLRRSEFPGTAVLWEERYFEVIEARMLPQGGVEYVLEPWQEHHVMRVVQQYDEPSEAARLAEHRAQLEREKKRQSANLLALLTGHLPAVVQNSMASDLGLLPNRITFVSVLGVYVALVGVVLWIVTFMMRGAPPPVKLVLLAIYLGIENTIRFAIVYTQSRPIGSFLGLIAYTAWWLATGRRATSPFKVEKGLDVRISETPEERKLHDSLILREPFLTLLPAEQQARLAERYGYAYRGPATAMAVLILVFASIGVASSIHRQAVVSTLIAAALAGEQVVRLVIMRQRPMGSILGWLVRPFVRKLL